MADLNKSRRFLLTRNIFTEQGIYTGEIQKGLHTK